MTKEELIIIDDLLSKGYTTRTLSILDGTFIFTIRNLQAKEQLAAEAALKSGEQSQLQSLHTYAFNLLAFALISVEVNGKRTEFKTANEAEAYIHSKPAALIELIAKEHSALEKDVVTLLQGANTSENFSQTPLTVNAQN